MAEPASASLQRPDKSEQIAAILGPDIFRWALGRLPPGVSIDDVRHRDLIDVTEEEVLQFAMANGFDPRIVWTDDTPGPVDDRLSVVKHRDGWRVSYAERGVTSQEMTFTRHVDACREVVRRQMRLARIVLNSRYWHAHGLAFPCDTD